MTAFHMSSRLRAAFLAAAIVGAFQLQPETAPAAELPLPPRRPVVATDVHNYGKTDPKCSSWSDGCRSCRRGDSGAAICSNIGIACQTGEVKCTARH